MIDFMVMEAVALKVNKEDAEARKDAERRDWKSTKNKDNFANLDKFR